MANVSSDLSEATQASNFVLTESIWVPAAVQSRPLCNVIALTTMPNRQESSFVTRSLKEVQISPWAVRAANLRDEVRCWSSSSNLTILIHTVLCFPFTCASGIISTSNIETYIYIWYLSSIIFRCVMVPSPVSLTDGRGWEWAGWSDAIISKRPGMKTPWFGILIPLWRSYRLRELLAVT